MYIFNTDCTPCVLFADPTTRPPAHSPPSRTHWPIAPSLGTCRERAVMPGAQFKGAGGRGGGGDKIGLDASVYTVASVAALWLLPRIQPHARFIIMLREPMPAFISWLQVRLLLLLSRALLLFWNLPHLPCRNCCSSARVGRSR